MTGAGFPPRLKAADPACLASTSPATASAGTTRAALVRRWGRDRALASAVVDDLCLVTCTALAHAVRLRPSSVCVRLRWADPDHVRVDVEWQGVEHPGASRGARGATRATAEVMDAVAVAWGLKAARRPGSG